MMRKKNSQILCLLIAYLFSSAHLTADPVSEIFPNWYSTDVEGSLLRMAYVSNYPIEAVSNNIDRVVILVHGARRGRLSYDRVLAAIEQNNVADSTILLMPQFLEEEDINAFQLPNDVLFWSGGWRQGHLSHSGTNENPRPSARISSFEIVNRVVEQLVANNTAVRNVVIAGHSAGGQYSQRFAAGSQLEQLLALSNVAVRYVSANPSSFVYFNNERRIQGTIDQFSIPAEEERLDCPGYNEYKYGLEDLNSFMNTVGIDQVIEQYPIRNLRYLQGANDNDPNGSLLSNSCEAKLQGAQRLERGVIFYHHIKQFFEPSIHKRHLQAVIPGFGHSSSIFASPCGSNFLLDIGNCSIVTPTNLTASNDNGAVILVWTDHAEGETGYEIERSSDGRTYQPIALLGKNEVSFTDNTIISSTNHYRVRGVAGIAKTNYSNIAAISVPSTEPKEEPVSGEGGAISLVLTLIALLIFFLKFVFASRIKNDLDNGSE